jgi:(E)-4-hydroxy-3-methylbut-2-enyl-diphosphate synthase
MANTDTRNAGQCLEQYDRLVRAGAELVRFSVQGLRELRSLKAIVEQINSHPGAVPVVADVHFNPVLALEAAGFCSKVRINPGNYTGKKSERQVYTREAFLKLLDACKNHGTALRIGVNHGSLSGRITDRFGDTPAGMVESAMEFLRICGEERFHNVVVSMKASSVRMMVYATRLLVKQMISENLYFPVHLGVTEAGNMEEGRLKSVIGMAALLTEGIGDTLRVSLTEDPVKEIPVAKKIAGMFQKPRALSYDPLHSLPWNPFDFERPVRAAVLGIGGSHPPAVFSSCCPEHREQAPDAVVETSGTACFIQMGGQRYAVLPEAASKIDTPCFLEWNAGIAPDGLVSLHGPFVVVLESSSLPIRKIKEWLLHFHQLDLAAPIVLRRSYNESDREAFLLSCGGETGTLLVDGLIDGLWIENAFFSDDEILELSFSILQASGVRITRTEYIACPSCGRTLFDIEQVLQDVKKATHHLSGLKIAVMGCIVNGPGEMADADYGYVGSGKDRVSLYRGRQLKVKNIPKEEAVEQLIRLIRDNNDWTDP